MTEEPDAVSDLYERLEAFHVDLEEHRKVEHARQNEMIGELLDAVVGPRLGALHDKERDTKKGLLVKVQRNTDVLTRLESHLDNGGVPSKVKVTTAQWVAIIAAIITAGGGVTVGILNFIADITH